MTTNGNTPHNEITLPVSRVTLRLAPVAPALIEMILTRHVPLPDAPVVMIKSIAGHEEPYHDENNEAYKQALGIAKRRRFEIHNDLMLLHGIVIDMPQDDAWLEPLTRAGVTLEAQQPFSLSDARKLTYLKIVAFKSIADSEAALKALYDWSYPSEERIAAMMESFQHNSSGS